MLDCLESENDDDCRLCKITGIGKVSKEFSPGGEGTNGNQDHDTLFST